MKKQRKSRRKRPFRTLLNHVAYAAVAALVRLVERMDFRAARALGRAAGTLAFHVSGRERAQALAHLEQAFPRLLAVERRRLARRSFEHMAMAGATALVFPRLAPWRLRRILPNYDEYMAHLASILSEGRGFIALTGHLGNWESLAGIGGRVFPANVVANRLNFEKWNRLLERLREGSNLKVIYLSESPREIVRAARRGEIVGLLPDQDIRSLPGVFVDFFGKPAWTPVGPVLTARLTKAPLIPFFMVHEGNSYRFVWEDEVPLTFTGDREADLVENTARWSRVMEEVIRRYPDQWAWNHKRWKTRPGDPKAGRE